MSQTAQAEQLPPNQAVAERPQLYAVPDVMDEPQVYSVTEVEFEPEAVARYKRWMGALAIAPAEASEIEEKPAEVNLLERLLAAREGSQEARDSLCVNVDTTVYEAVFIEDYVGETFMDRDEEGNLVQHGQTNADIHHNAIALRPNRHSVLKAITEAESLNRHRIETALETGTLQTHNHVMFSLVPNGVPEAELGPDGDGYFLDSLAMSIQTTSELPDGRVKTETAFMPGVEDNGKDTFDERLEKRYDFAAVTKLYEWLGQEAPDTAAGLVGGGLYIPKDMMPHGSADVMYWLDCAKAEVLGKELEKGPEDYAGLRLKSKRQEASLKEVRHNVLEDLLAAEDLKTPMEATQRLWDLVRDHATDASFTNLNIDPRAFGRAAAPAIIKARHHIEKGNNREAVEYMLKALEQSVVAGCGGGSRSGREEQQKSVLSTILEKIAGTDEFGSLAFICSNGHLCVRPYNEKISACQHEDCKAKVAC